MLILKDFRVSTVGRLLWASVFNSKDNSIKTYNEFSFFSLIEGVNVLGALSNYRENGLHIYELRRNGVGLCTKVVVPPVYMMDSSLIMDDEEPAQDSIDTSGNVRKYSISRNTSDLLKYKGVLEIAIKQARSKRGVYMSDYLVKAYRYVRDSGEHPNLISKFEKEVGVL